MKRTGTLALLLAVLILGLLATACGSTSTDATPSPVGTAGSGVTSPGAADSTHGGTPGAKPGGEAYGSTTETQTAKLGDAVDLGGYTMTLTCAKFEDGWLKSLFTVGNSKGKDAVNIRPTGFSATDADGKSMDPDIICSTLAVLVDAGK